MGETASCILSFVNLLAINQLKKILTLNDFLKGCWFKGSSHICFCLKLDASVLPGLHAPPLWTTSTNSHPVTSTNKTAAIWGAGTAGVWF